MGPHSSRSLNEDRLGDRDGPFAMALLDDMLWRAPGICEAGDKFSDKPDRGSTEELDEDLCDVRTVKRVGGEDRSPSEDRALEASPPTLGPPALRLSLICAFDVETTVSDDETRACAPVPAPAAASASISSVPDDGAFRGTAVPDFAGVGESNDDEPSTGGRAIGGETGCGDAGLLGAPDKDEPFLATVENALADSPLPSLESLAASPSLLLMIWLILLSLLLLLSMLEVRIMLTFLVRRVVEDEADDDLVCLDEAAVDAVDALEVDIGERSQLMSLVAIFDGLNMPRPAFTAGVFFWRLSGPCGPLSKFLSVPDRMLLSE